MTVMAPPRRFLEPLPDMLLGQPLDYVLADHLRQRVLCVLCDQIADAVDNGGAPDQELAAEVVTYLTRDLVVHVIDEEQDLFPLIRRRAKLEDRIEPTLAQLSGEHATDESLAESIADGLAAFLESGTGPPADLSEKLRRFAHSQRHHLALENATVMPLAKRCLKPRDLRDLSGRMAARRGLLLAGEHDTGTPE